AAPPRRRWRSPSSPTTIWPASTSPASISATRSTSPPSTPSPAPPRCRRRRAPTPARRATRRIGPATASSEAAADRPMPAHCCLLSSVYRYGFARVQGREGKRPAATSIRMSLRLCILLMSVLAVGCGATDSPTHGGGGNGGTGGGGGGGGGGDPPLGGGGGGGTGGGDCTAQPGGCTFTVYAHSNTVLYKVDL